VSRECFCRGTGLGRVWLDVLMIWPGGCSTWQLPLAGSLQLAMAGEGGVRDPAFTGGVYRSARFGLGCGRKGVQRSGEPALIVVIFRQRCSC